MDRTGEAIAALERAVALAPQAHFSLSRAYRRAGRTEDAARERAEFERLDRQWREEKEQDVSEQEERTFQ